MRRRSLLAASLGVSGLAAPAIASAQGAWPNRNVRIVVPFTPGGASDIIIRPVAARLEQMLGRSFVIENRAGGGGAIGAGAVAADRPDGYTFLVSTPAPLILLPQIMTGLTYNPDRAFSYVSLLGGAPIVCAVKGDSPMRTLAEYATAAKAREEAVSYGSSGIGSVGHLTGVLFGMETGARLLHAPFRGAPEAQQAVLGGSTTSLWDTAGANVAAIRAGNMRGLAVSSATRAAALPDVPTAIEAGFPGVVSTNWFLLAAPVGTDSAIIARMDEAVQTILADATIKERLEAAGIVALPRTAPADIAAWVAAEKTRWTPVIRASGAALG
ncbi:Bug family tripartite tricarboxylate transporter substrate binding protein [Plastoroseomonas arctica]|uniref:Tripartite tricarboxylate transporter substrate binding protein n=1 Tax=Plastoroseomonas arctica TaxID=1509237 RepID=A0AAF1JY23_9PROT|nr:tripartite tricarboxylate transporter substrate binding protein [Plastoroseomonas arctica]MBR0656569.1 tripartite tricarboxylate transporter substrate binding protein [Plastoroseomonas arctica]